MSTVTHEQVEQVSIRHMVGGSISYNDGEVLLQYIADLEREIRFLKGDSEDSKLVKEKVRRRKKRNGKKYHV